MIDASSTAQDATVELRQELSSPPWSTQVARGSRFAQRDAMMGNDFALGRGAPVGNQNAVGNGGAPVGSQNAVGNRGGGAPFGNQNALVDEHLWVLLQLSDVEHADRACSARRRASSSCSSASTTCDPRFLGCSSPTQLILCRNVNRTVVVYTVPIQEVFLSYLNAAILDYELYAITIMNIIYVEVPSIGYR